MVIHFFLTKNKFTQGIYYFQKKICFNTLFQKKTIFFMRKRLKNCFTEKSLFLLSIFYTFV